MRKLTKWVRQPWNGCNLRGEFSDLWHKNKNVEEALTNIEVGIVWDHLTVKCFVLYTWIEDCLKTINFNLAKNKTFVKHCCLFLLFRGKFEPYLECKVSRVIVWKEKSNDNLWAKIVVTEDKLWNEKYMGSINFEELFHGLFSNFIEICLRGCQHVSDSAYESPYDSVHNLHTTGMGIQFFFCHPLQRIVVTFQPIQTKNKLVGHV
jgi:hypothetical protein